MADVKAKEEKAPVGKLKGNPTDEVKVKCIKKSAKRTDKLVIGTVYTVSVDVANALISKKLVKIV